MRFFKITTDGSIFNDAVYSWNFWRFLAAFSLLTSFDRLSFQPLFGRQLVLVGKERKLRSGIEMSILLLADAQQRFKII